MSLYKNRKRFAPLSSSVGRIFGSLGISANVFTFIGLIITLVAAYFIASGSFLNAAIVFAAAAFFDMVDGAVARKRKEDSSLGAYYDTIADRYTEGIMALSLMFAPLPVFYLPSYIWAAVYLFGSMMVTYAKAAAAEKLQTEVTGGLLERPERMILLFIGLLGATMGPLYLTYVLAILAILTNITALQRIYTAINTGANKR